MCFAWINIYIYKFRAKNESRSADSKHKYFFFLALPVYVQKAGYPSIPYMFLFSEMAIIG